MLRRLIWPFACLVVTISLTLYYRIGDLSWIVPPQLRDAFKKEGPLQIPDIDTHYPPSYRTIRKAEWSLPQHNLDLPFPEGRDGRYVKFSCQVQQLGWNNVLNEILMNSFLAYKSNRAYVFSDLIWKPEYYPWPKRKAIEWPPRTPLSALISGPSVGGLWPANDTAPRTISEAWWEVVCPPERRRVISVADIKPQFNDFPGEELFAGWQKILYEAPESCIDIQNADSTSDRYPQVFDLWLWGSSRILSLWDAFSKSPVSTLLGPSDIVVKALENNENLFHTEESGEEMKNPYNRMLAIHLRRGDFREACIKLSDFHSTFYSWNLHGFLPDRFSPPPGGTWGKNTPENEALVLEHCLPSDEAILQKIRHSRTEYFNAIAKAGVEKQEIDVLYILTNEESEWLDDVKQLLKDEGWKVVTNSGDLTLDIEGKDVGMAIDMEIAVKAAIFVGNGWSSFTSNILHRRLVNGRIAMSNRFY